MMSHMWERVDMPDIRSGFDATDICRGNLSFFDAGTLPYSYSSLFLSLYL